MALRDEVEALNSAFMKAASNQDLDAVMDLYAVAVEGSGDLAVDIGQPDGRLCIAYDTFNRDAAPAN